MKGVNAEGDSALRLILFRVLGFLCFLSFDCNYQLREHTRMSVWASK